MTTVLLSRPHARNAVDGATARRARRRLPRLRRRPRRRGRRPARRGRHVLRRRRPQGGRHAGRQPDRARRRRPDGPDPAAAAQAGDRRRSPGTPSPGGLELALWCDLRVADENAVLGVFCRRWGVPLIDGGTVRLPRLIGASRAMDLILTGRAVDAARGAARSGSSTAWCPPARRWRRRRRWPRELAAFPQTCLREDRASLLEQDGLDEAAALANEFAHGMTRWPWTPSRCGPVRRGRGPPRRGHLMPGGATHRVGGPRTWTPSGPPTTGSPIVTSPWAWVSWMPTRGCARCSPPSPRR